MESYKTKKKSNISRNIKKYRLKRGMNQKEFADYLKMHYQNFSQMERGVYTPSLEKILEICDRLHITPNDLLLTENDEKVDEDNVFAELDITLLDIEQTMKIVEKIRAKAIVSKKSGDVEKEKLHLDEMIHIFAWKNEHYWEIADFLYKSNLEKSLLAASKKMEEKLVKKQLRENQKNESH